MKDLYKRFVRQRSQRYQKEEGGEGGQPKCPSQPQNESRVQSAEVLMSRYRDEKRLQQNGWGSSGKSELYSSSYIQSLKGGADWTSKSAKRRRKEKKLIGTVRTHF